MREATKQAVRCFDWLLTGAHFVGTGAGLMALNNLGQIAIAQGASAWVYAGCTGRLLIRVLLVSDTSSHRRIVRKWCVWVNLRRCELVSAAGSVLFSVVLAAQSTQSTRNKEQLPSAQSAIRLRLWVCRHDGR